MWLVTSLIAAVAATAAWRMMPGNHRLDTLALMLWGLTMMILVDHILGYEGGAFLEVETDGLVSNGALLGALMLIPVIAIWAVYMMLSKSKEKPAKE